MGLFMRYLGFLFIGLMVCAMSGCGASSVSEPKAAHAQFDPKFGSYPIVFEPNLGQMPEQIQFLGRTKKYNLYFKDNQLFFDVTIKTPGTPDPLMIIPDDQTLSEGKTASVSMKLLGANSQAKPEGVEQLTSMSQYRIGPDPKKWADNVPHYGKVKYDSIYPGIDAIFYGNEGMIEYDFIVAPHQDPNQIRFQFQGAQSLVLAEDGYLEIHVSADVMLVLKAPTIYQEIKGQRVGVTGGYQLDSNQVVSFKLGSYDSNYALVIDPATVKFSALLGGSQDEITWGIATDSSDNVYVCGYTKSNDFFGGSSSRNSSSSWDAFVTKLNSSGTSVYSVYFGGTGNDLCDSIKVDGSGNAFITGYTTSTDMSTTGGFQVANAGGYDAYVAQFDSSGSLVYASYLGGSGFERGAQIALDPASTDVVVMGTTSSSGLGTGGVVQSSFGGGKADAFVARIGQSGSGFTKNAYTYVGGSGLDLGTGLAVDASGNVYASLTTCSAGNNASGLLTTAGVLKTDWTRSGADTQEAYLASYSSDLTTRNYATFLGGNGADTSGGIALDESSSNCAGGACVVVAGTTESTDLSVVNAYQAALAGGKDAYLAKLDTAATGFIYLTYLGGTGNDQVQGFQSVATDTEGGVWLVGDTASSDLPIAQALTSNTTFTGATANSFIARFPNPNTSTKLNFATYFGGTSAGMSDNSLGVVIDSSDRHAYVSGMAGSSNFLTTIGNSHASGIDGFASRLFVPSVQTVGTPTCAVMSNNTSSSSAITITSPNGIQTGDLLVAIISTPLLPTNMTSSGWTSNGSWANGTSFSFWVLTKLVSVGDAGGTNYTFTAASGGSGTSAARNQRKAGTMFAFRNAKADYFGSNLLYVGNTSGVDGNAVSGNQITSNSVTISFDSSLIFYVFQLNGSVLTSSGFSGSTSQACSQRTTGTGNNTSQLILYQTKDNAAQTSSEAITAGFTTTVSYLSRVFEVKLE